jgi:hypothetical protein
MRLQGATHTDPDERNYRIRLLSVIIRLCQHEFLVPVYYNMGTLPDS